MGEMGAVDPFAGRQTRILGMEEVRGLLDMRSALEVQREAFVSHASGNATAMRNAWLRLPEPRRAWLKILAGHDASTAALGVKILARFPDNPSGANLGSLVVLLDDESGFPLAVMDGVYLTAVRTGAAAGLATEALARADAALIGILGTGVVARFSLEAMMLTRPGLGSLKVYSRSPERREAFAEFARDLGLDASPVGSVDEAVRDVDIIVTASNSQTPILRPHHVWAGQLVNAMGIRTEVDPRVIAMSVVVADGREESCAEGKFSVALSDGVVSAEDIRADLGEVLAGTADIASGDDVIVFDSSGVATQDVDAARVVWERAERQDVGTLVDFGLTGTP